MAQTTEDKALALVNEVAKECWQRPDEPYSFQIFETLCRAIEQHEAFRQEVSDAVEERFKGFEAQYGVLERFIIHEPKPDPLREIAEAWGLHNTVAKSWVEDLRATLEARGFEIREKNDDADN